MPSPRRKSVALLFLGGATIDERQRLGETVTQASHVKPWLRAMSEMDIIAETQGFFIASGITMVGLSEWQATAKKIHDLYDEHDGFVIIHQLETLPAAATALSLMVSGIGKPVALCSSPLMSVDERGGRSPAKTTLADFGAKAGFINAVQVAVSDVAGVIVIFGSHIYRGQTVGGSMTSLTGDILGKIDFGLRFFGTYPRRTDRAWKLMAAFDTRVAIVEYLPGVDVRHFLPLPRGTRAIFMSSPEGVGVMRGAAEQLRRLLPPTIPLIIYGSQASSDRGTLAVDSPTRSAALLKLMWALGQTTDQKKLKKLLS